MYKVIYHENLDIKSKCFQNKWNLIKFLKSIVVENSNNIHYYYKDYKENNIISENDNITIKYYGNVKNPYINKDYELFRYIHNNLWIKSKIC